VWIKGYDELLPVVLNLTAITHANRIENHLQCEEHHSVDINKCLLVDETDGYKRHYRQNL
jgi:hypothetical protein